MAPRTYGWRASDPYSTWQAEQARNSPLPSIAATFFLFAVVALVLISLLGGTLASAQSGDQSAPQRRSFCEQHAGDRSWDGVCAESTSRR